MDCERRRDSGWGQEVRLNKLCWSCCGGWNAAGGNRGLVMRGGGGFRGAREVFVNGSWLMFRCDGDRDVQDWRRGVVDAWLQKGTKSWLFCICREHANYVCHPSVLWRGCRSSGLTRVSGERVVNGAVMWTSFMTIETC